MSYDVTAPTAPALSTGTSEKAMPTQQHLAPHESQGPVAKIQEMRPAPCSLSTEIEVHQVSGILERLHVLVFRG